MFGLKSHTVRIIRYVRPPRLFGHIYNDPLNQMSQKLFYVIKVTVYGTLAPSVAMYAGIYAACAFHLAPWMPFQSRYYVHHITHACVASLRSDQPKPQPHYGCNTMRVTITFDETPSVSVSHFIPYLSAPDLLSPSLLLSSLRFSWRLHTPAFHCSRPQLPSGIPPIPFFFPPLPSILVFLPNHSNLFSLRHVTPQIWCTNGDMVRCCVITERRRNGLCAVSRFVLCTESRSGAFT